MTSGALRITEVQLAQGDRTIIVWRLRGHTPCILRVEFTAESFPAYCLPSRASVPGGRPGTIIFGTYPDLAEARDMFPRHNDIWNAVRDDYWAALLAPIDTPQKA
ncbi:MAG: Uncharacterized protein JWN03_4791 [Nocardia sp.]|uniref:hypothetical protein n=1 Tax=Nocardia sp. TaxID=1821 RepID=UPI002638F53C|nr:hypothetical protein [Nocardia sp.]MCU1644516.1 Uncharacterized protein [Nocardia sp.]